MMLMATKECPSCAVEVDKKYDVCPICGYEFPKQKSGMKYLAIILVILFTLPLIKLILSLL